MRLGLPVRHSAGDPGLKRFRFSFTESALILCFKQHFLAISDVRRTISPRAIPDAFRLQRPVGRKITMA
jgi:hypothetical protein